MNSHDEIRIIIAQKAARLIFDEGLDARKAKYKAGKDFGSDCALGHGHYMPTYCEIYLQLQAYMAKIDPDLLHQRRCQLLSLAIDAYDFFQDYTPYLIGDIIDNISSPYSRVKLIVYADHPDEIEDLLYQNDIDFESAQPSKHNKQYSAVTIDQDNGIVECLIFPRSKRHQRLKSPMTGQSITRLSIKQLRELLTEETTRNLHCK